MSPSETLEPEQVADLSYPDFVAFIGQANTPPGARRTLEDWIALAGIDGSARLLDLACSTGYSSRTLAELTGCAAVGVDQSAAAIEVARTSARTSPHGDRLSYRVGDAASLAEPDAEFTHVVAGGCFGFIAAREQALDECARVLEHGGKLCVSSFFYREPPSESLLDRVAEAIGYRPDSGRDLAWWRRFFSRRFELVDERPYELAVHDEAALRAAVRRYIDVEGPLAAVHSPELREACFRRLSSIRIVLNEHRRYQSLTVAAWRVR